MKLTQQISADRFHWTTQYGAVPVPRSTAETAMAMIGMTAGTVNTP